MMDTIIIFIFHNTDFFFLFSGKVLVFFQIFTLSILLCDLPELHHLLFLSSHSTASSVPRWGCGIFLSSFFITLWFTGTALSMIYQTNIFLLAITFWLELSDKSPSQIPRVFYSLFSGTASGFCSYHLFIWSNVNCLHSSQCIAISPLSCLFLYFLWASLLHSLMQFSCLLQFFSFIYFALKCFSDGFVLSYNKRRSFYVTSA